jgi:hypothetical protein
MPKHSARPFTKLNQEGSTATHGSTVYYRTPEGAVYEVVLWITDSAGASAERFNSISQGIEGKQALKLGDEAFITPAGNRLFIAIRYRNMNLELSRPDPKGTTPKPLTDSQALDLMTALFKQLPQGK